MNGIKAARKALGLSQEQLASMIGTTAGAVSQWECGRSFPRAAKLNQLSEILGVPVNSLLKVG